MANYLCFAASAQLAAGIGAEIIQVVQDSRYLCFLYIISVLRIARSVNCRANSDFNYIGFPAVNGLGDLSNLHAYFQDQIGFMGLFIVLISILTIWQSHSVISPGLNSNLCVAARASCKPRRAGWDARLTREPFRMTVPPFFLEISNPMAQPSRR